MPGDRKPSKRRSRPERERIEYATDALDWLDQQLEPAPQLPPADPRPQLPPADPRPYPPGPPAPERPRQAMAVPDTPPEPTP
ncbi:MAG TPA: hypothetical protein VHM23_25895, partial [Actinomycetota bacterium]|nr:hypothetical protein [Actinomycetota bacterium]